jgi:5'-nucleotidase
MRKTDFNFKQRRPVILVDIDDTLNRFAETYWELHNHVFEDNVHYRSVDKWDLDLFSNRGEEAYHLFKIPGLFRNIPVKPYAKEFMNSIQKIGDVFVVSDAPSGTSYGDTVDFSNFNYSIEVQHSNPVDDKRAWLKENFPTFPTENIIFCSCKWMISGDILIDDKPDTFMEFQKRGRDAILMDMPYNQMINTKWRAKDLKEAEEMICVILNKNGLLSDK